MTTCQTPTTAEAITYVRDHFAQFPECYRPVIYGTVAPGFDSSGELPHVRDVLICFPHDPQASPARFSVWFEELPGMAPFIYGEW